MPPILGGWNNAHVLWYFEGFPLSWCIVWVATAMTNVFNLASVKMMGICKESITSLYRWFRFRIVYIMEFVWTIFREDMLMVIYLCGGCFNFFFFHPKIGEMVHFDESYFSTGLVQHGSTTNSSLFQIRTDSQMQDAIHARPHRPVLLASTLSSGGEHDFVLWIVESSPGNLQTKKIIPSAPWTTLLRVCFGQNFRVFLYILSKGI